MKVREHLRAAAKSTSITATVLAVSAAAEGGAALTTKLVLLAVATLGTPGLLLVRRRDDLSREGQVGAEVLNALVSEIAVVVLPREGDTNEATGLKGFHETHDLKIRGTLDVGVGRGDGVLFDNKDALLEEVGEGYEKRRIGQRTEIYEI